MHSEIEPGLPLQLKFPLKDYVKEFYLLQQPQDDDIEDNGSECVICMCETRDTLILPCRHLCLCNSCADNLRYQANNCPICRAKFHALLQIKAMRKRTTSPTSPGTAQVFSVIFIQLFIMYFCIYFINWGKCNNSGTNVLIGAVNGYIWKIRPCSLQHQWMCLEVLLHCSTGYRWNCTGKWNQPHLFLYCTHCTYDCAYLEICLVSFVQYLSNKNGVYAWRPHEWISTN